MLSRTQKQLIIGGIYILIALIIAGGVYWAKFSPTCSDNKQNGKEEGVDCGTLACGQACAAPVQALLIQTPQLIKTPVGDFDLAFGVYNPNINYGAEAVFYDLIITDPDGKEVLRRANNFYILQGQTKYVIQTSLRNIPDNSTASVEVKSVTWEKVVTTDKVNFIVTREAITPSANQTTYEAVVMNDSNFDFETLDINVVVLDNSGKVVATNMTNLQTLLSHTERSVKVSWPFKLPEGVRIQIEVGTNVFNNTNFLKQNGSQEKFQQYF